MFLKHILNLGLIWIFTANLSVTTGRLVIDSTDSLDSNTLPITSPPTSTTPSSTTNSMMDNLRICTDLRPDYMTTRNGRYQTLECTARLCGLDSSPESGAKFNQPVFEWKCQLGHLVATNGTCDYDRNYCWASIDMDIKYFSHKMSDYGLQEMPISCAVTDAFLTPDGGHDDIVLLTGVDYSYLKRYTGKTLDERCDTDVDCRDNMYCMTGGITTTQDTTCQCRMDYSMGVQYVAVMDDKYGEWSCVPPLLLNESCQYDSQCQAMDANAVCGDLSGSPGRCICDQNSVYYLNGCQTKRTDDNDYNIDDPSSSTPKSAIIWWIFSDDYGSGDRSGSSGGRYSTGYWWLRWTAYVMAVMAIILPLLLLIIATIMLCHRRALARRRAPHLATSGGGVSVQRPRFPAPKIIISDLKSTIISGNKKPDDKYNLVENDQLANQY